MIFRLATEQDVPAITAIYEAIHTEEEQGRVHIGWVRGVYPTEATARQDGGMYVLEDQGRVVASARINEQQVPAYAQASWRYEAERVLVMHTLVVDPAEKGKGYGTAMVRFYEQMAWQLGIAELRIDTNANNTTARRMYAHLGWEERGVIPCVFNGIEGVPLVCLEKHLTQGE